MARQQLIEKEIRHHTIVSTAGDKQELLNTLHAHLNCVDSKTSVLLTYNALLIAVLSLVVGSADLRNALPHGGFWQVLMIISAGLTVTSAALCLAGLDIIGAHSNRDSTTEDYIACAAEVCVGRTARYRLALGLTAAASIVVLLAFLVSMRLLL